MYTKTSIKALVRFVVYICINMASEKLSYPSDAFPTSIERVCIVVSYMYIVLLHSFSGSSRCSELLLHIFPSNMLRSKREAVQFIYTISVPFNFGVVVAMKRGAHLVADTCSVCTQYDGANFRQWTRMT